MILRQHRRAEAEFRGALAWYREESVEVAIRFHAAVLETLNKIESDPERFSVLETLGEATHIRRARVMGFPYVVIFELLEAELFVFAIAHTSRRPGYWRRRKRQV